MTSPDPTRWTITKQEYLWINGILYVTITTNIPTGLTLYATQDKPSLRSTRALESGRKIHATKQYGFAFWHSFPQQEMGFVLVHTFHLQPWQPGQELWWYFRGFTYENLTPTNSIIFTNSHPGNPVWILPEQGLPNTLVGSFNLLGGPNILAQPFTTPLAFNCNLMVFYLNPYPTATGVVLIRVHRWLGTQPSLDYQDATYCPYPPPAPGLQTFFLNTPILLEKDTPYAIVMPAPTNPTNSWQWTIRGPFPGAQPRPWKSEDSGLTWYVLPGARKYNLSLGLGYTTPP